MSLGILCWVAGSPAARAPAHLIGEIPCAPLGTRSREICRLIRAREAASRRGSVHLHVTFIRTDLNQRKRLMRRRCGVMDQEMSGTVPVIGADQP